MECRTLFWHAEAGVSGPGGRVVPIEAGCLKHGNGRRCEEVMAIDEYSGYQRFNQHQWR
jgi:hypothetical protein